MNYDRDIVISTAGSSKSRAWLPQPTSWSAFASRLKSPQWGQETMEEYLALPKAQQDSRKDVGGYVGGTLQGDRRRKGEVLGRDLVTLDMDALPQDGVAQVIRKLDILTCGWALYTTRRHRQDTPRLRVVIPLSKTIPGEDYEAAARMLAYWTQLAWCDPTTFQPERMMYWPSACRGAEYLCEVRDRPLLDPDLVLSVYQNPRDQSSWPTLPAAQAAPAQGEGAESAIGRRRKRADPRQKPGIVGAFCRAYTIEEAIAAFLPQVYATSLVQGRYDYLSADSTAGLIVYDGLYAYSHHATDPVCGKSLHAFDLVAAHRFPQDEQKVRFMAMSELAIGDERVRALLAQELKDKAQEEGAPPPEDWMALLEFEPRSARVKNTLSNLTLILQHDKHLQGIVFNQLSDGMEIKDEVPWQHPSKFWRDADDAQLVSFVDRSYGSFNARNYSIAVTKVTDDRSYHPIRDFLAAMPAWDGQKRVDTLLVDYLGAQDNAYVRAVTRKTLCAAIRRVLQPGCKFDSMLVLNGPQGIGKSTLISKLAGEWFSDSLNLGDTRDKTAAEKLQGYWIMEIGELAGLRKTEVETLRSFLTRQNDIYRAAFGKRASPHPRQCIFLGTTNAQTGYLRDTTGNRRFWPVKTPGGGKLKSWDLSPELIGQIWAEALCYTHAGEKLFLDPEMDALAKSEQRDAMESDDREGLVRDYLQTLLPQEWDKMDLCERRNYLTGEELNTGKTGINKRESVCTMEIWCECFGKDRANLGRREAYDIAGILARIEDWTRSEEKIRIPLYGPQCIYIPKGSS